MRKRKKTTKKLAVQDSQSLSLSEKRQFLLDDFKYPYDPESLISGSYDSVHKKKKNNEDYSKIMQAITTLGFENDYIVTDAIEQRYYGLAIEMRRQLIKDFDCKNYAEKVLVDTIVNGYIRTLQYTRHFNTQSQREFLSGVANQQMSVLSKEMDRAQRQLTTAYQILVQLKTPPLKVQVTAETAFIAQNQQLNMAAKPAENSHD